MTHHSHVSGAVFSRIARGKRQIEPRLHDEPHRRVRLGDLIIFTNRETGAEVVAKVVGVLRYDSFEKLFAAFPPGYFGVGTVEELRAETASWSTPAGEVRHGVLGLKLHVLHNQKGP